MEINLNSTTLTENKPRKDDDRTKRLKALSIKLRSSYFPEPELAVVEKPKGESLQKPEVFFDKVALSAETEKIVALSRPKTRSKKKVAVDGNLFSRLFDESITSLNMLSDFDLIKLSREGFRKSSLLSLGKSMSLTIQEVGDIIHISERTLQRYDDHTLIKAEYAEKAIELIRLYNRGEEVFGSMGKFKRWIKTPAYVFNGMIPVSLLDTSIGFHVVFKELGRIEHGIFA